MKKIALLILILANSYSFSDDIIKLECDKLKSSVQGNEVTCLDLNLDYSYIKKIEKLSSISEPLQEWMWLSDKMEKTISDNYKKKEVLEETEKSFKLAKKGYPNGAVDVEHLERVEEYAKQYEEIFKATRSESMLHDALNLCYGAGGFRCTHGKIDDLKIKYANAQSKKLSLLITYPLLSSEVVRESIEDEIDLYKKYNKGDVEGYSSFDEFSSKRENTRRAGFHDVMLEGIGSTKEALASRQKKWKSLYKKSSNNATGDIKVQLGEKKQSFLEKTLFSSYKEKSQDLQTDNTEMITELLAGVDINNEIKNPYIGKSICNIHNRNQEQIKIDKRNQLVLDSALIVAPFFLGPLGLAARLATMGRFANWGVKGRIMVSGALEGGLIAKDLSDLSGTLDKCNGIKVRLLNTAEVKSTSRLSNKERDSRSTNMQRMKSCQDELNTQLLVSIGGAALGPMAFMYSKASRAGAGLSKKGTSILSKFSMGRDNSAVKSMLKNENLSEVDLLAIQKDFKAFKKESGFSGDELMVKYKQRYDKKYSISCSI